jgi:hypothetical protein
MRIGVVGTKRTAWHYFFGILLRKRGPRGIEVRDEVSLSDEPPRLDYLILRKTEAFDPADPGETLKGLWPLLPRVSAVELKSIGRTYRSGNLDRLWIYAHAVCACLVTQMSVHWLPGGFGQSKSAPRRQKWQFMNSKGTTK